MTTGGVHLWREGYVPGGDTRFFCRALGQGDEVALLLHGWPEDGSAWRRVAPLLVDQGMRVVAPDLKGFGRTEATTRAYDPATLADEISDLIRHLHVRKAVLVGHDWGGAVALATAFRHPGHVRAVVMVSAPYRQLDLRHSWHIPLFNLPLLPEAAFAVAARPLVAKALRWASANPEAFGDDDIARYAEAIAANPRAWLAYYRSLSRRAVLDRSVGRARRRLNLGPHRGAQPIRVPVTVVWGEDERVMPVRLGELTARDLKAPLIRLPDVGHFPPEEDPRGVAEAILAAARTSP